MSEKYIKYLKIFVLSLWALSASALFYYFFAGSRCDVKVSGKCFGEAGANRAGFELTSGENIPVSGASKLDIPGSYR